MVEGSAIDPIDRTRSGSESECHVSQSANEQMERGAANSSQSANQQQARERPEEGRNKETDRPSDSLMQAALGQK